MINDYAYIDEEGEKVTVLDLVRISLQGSTTFELCPHCGSETTIPMAGGRCENCREWVLPCSMCDRCKEAKGTTCPFAFLDPDKEAVE